MSTKTTEAKEGIDVEPRARLITGPWTEPADQGGLSYYRCADCGRESLRRGDLERSAFHAEGCAGRGL